MSYEFNAEEDKIISRVGLSAIIIAVIFLIGGLSDFWIVINQYGLDQGIVTVGFIILTLIQMIIGAVLILPASNFRRVATTEGNDIKELMQGMNLFSSSVNIIIGLAVLSFGILFSLFFFAR